ncbi:hypothetical protein Pmani_018426 [Petrolisthes manimaculis]|uniref:Uncharacterized protein n=1 Tax=Petrolisthes manimaculis TaxID=1843537 RepID=A0AAE1PMG1_9EUCA|nr:hypothetical protein Pmani_018426 [Petrolisthes manimaculis]
MYENFEDKARETRLSGYGHVQRRDREYVGRWMLEMELPDKRKRGRPKRRFMDAVTEDMREVGVMEEDARNRPKWKQVIRCGDP